MNYRNRLNSIFTTLTPQKFFLCIAISFGLFYVFFTPIFQGPDEPVHFFSIAKYSNGYITVNKENGKLGTRAQEGIFELYKYYPHIENQTKYDYKGQISKMLTIRLGEARGVFSTMVVGAPYTFVTYIQYITSYLILSLLNINPFIILIFLRLSGLSVWVLMSFYAIKLIPRGKWLLVGLTLLPISLFISSVISADNLTNGLVYVYVAVLLKNIIDGAKIEKKYFWIAVILALLIGLTKQTFFIASLLLFTLPKPKFISKRNYYLIIGSTIAVTSLLALSWQFLLGNWSVSPIPGVSGGGQIKYIITHPVGFSRAMLNTFLTSNSNPLYISFIGVLGLMDVSLPFWIIVGWFIILVKSIGIKISSIKKDLLSTWQKLLFILTPLLLFGALTLGLYITWTPVGGRFVSGHQGRYLLPLFALLIPLIVYKRKEPTPVQQKYIMIAIVLLEFSTLLVFLARYIKIF